MKVLQYKNEIKLNTSVDEIWAFISNPLNLKEVTPDTMHLRIEDEKNIKGMYEGQILKYRVTPMWNISTRWITKILEIKDKHYFVDEQKKGPYRKWEHKHSVIQKEGHVVLMDIINYQLPFPFFQSYLNKWFVKKRIVEMFEHRNKVLTKKYNKNEY